MVSGDVQLQGRERDVTLHQGTNIGTAFRNTSGGIATNPIIGTAARVDVLIETAVIHPQSLTGKTEALNLVIPQERYVYVKQNFGRQTVFDDALDDQTGG